MRPSGLLIFIILQTGMTALTGSGLNWINQTGDSLVFEIQSGSPVFIPDVQELTAGSAVLYTETTVIIMADAPALSVNVIHEDTEQFEGPLVAIKDAALGAPVTRQDIVAVSAQKYKVQSIGSYQGKTVFRLTVPSIIISGQNAEPGWLKKIRILCRAANIQGVSEAGRLAEVIGHLDQADALPAGYQTRNQPVSPSKVSMAGEGKLKIWIAEEGLYLLPHALIEDAGFEVSGINPGTIRVYSKDGEVPIRVVGGEDGSFDFTDYIEFYGEPLRDETRPGEKRKHIYSHENIYWMEISRNLGLRMGQEDVRVNNQGTSASRSFLFLEHFEEDLHFNRLPYSLQVSGADYWFYGSGIAGEEQRHFLVDLKSPDQFSTQRVTIRVKLRSQSQNYQDFNLEIYLNNHYVGKAVYGANDAIMVENTQFSPTYLREKSNQLSVMNKAGQEALTYIFLDWFEIEYPRLYEPDHDYLRFCPPKFSQNKFVEYRIAGFTEKNISLYKINSSRLIGGEAREVTDTLGVSTFTLVFQDSVLDETTRYLAVTPDAKKMPDSVKYVEFLDLKQPGLGADYIVIVPDDSLGTEILEPLLTLRESQGLSPMVINADTIYNEFNWGIPDTEAIRRFLIYAYKNWDPRPEYVLLVGDSYFDYRAGTDLGALLPVGLFQTYKYGAAPSDHVYTLLDGNDDLPEIAIGRLPVQTREELSRVVEKIVSFETSPPASWKNEYLLIGAGAGDDIFRNQSETLIRQVLPRELSPKRLYLSGSLSDPYVGGTQDLLNHLDQGVAMVNFRGHGGGAIWADAGLLDLDDIELIDNSQTLPIITSMTCFSGDFASHRTCLGEALLCQETSGAVAFWGASGVGWTLADYHLLTELYRLLGKNEIRTLGELIRQSKINYRRFNSGDIAESEMYQYTLLGDPATRIPFPDQTIDFTVTPRSVNPGETIQISGQMPQENGSYETLIQLTQTNYDAVESAEAAVSQSNWKMDMTVPADMPDGKSGVRVLFWDPPSEYFANGFKSFQTGGVFFDSLSTSPQWVTENDSVTIRANIQSAESANVWCRFFSPVPDSIPMTVLQGITYQTSRAAGPFDAGKRIRYAVFIRSQSGMVTSSDTVSTTVQPLPDLAIQTVTLGGSDAVYLETLIRNYNTSAGLSENSDPTAQSGIGNVVIRYEIPELSWTAYDTLFLPGVTQYLHRFPFYPPVQTVQLKVTINPDSNIRETSYANNSRLTAYLYSDRFHVSPGLGSMLSAGTHGNVGIQNRLSLTIPPGAVLKNTVVLVEDQTKAEMIDGHEIVEPVYFIDLPSIQEYPKLKKEMTLTLHLFVPDSGGLTKVYHRQNDARTWAVLPFEKKNDLITLHTLETGYFSTRSTQDKKPPEIEIQIENQPFTPNCYVARQPSISIILSDESGVDIRPGKIVIELNGRTQDESYFSVPDSLNDQKQVIVTYQPNLKPGDHRLLIMASDVHGNVRGPELVQFKVADRFEIHFMGNYPNPFKRETTFVFSLTESASQASLKIYTVSGRLIKGFDHYELTAPDYHEVVWDGTDDYGDEAANGVYFFKLEATGISRTERITGKIAKVR